MCCMRVGKDDNGDGVYVGSAVRVCSGLQSTRCVGIVVAGAVAGVGAGVGAVGSEHWSARIHARVGF